MRRMIGMLPPFHSFGLTVTVILPLCIGIPAVYHADPTEAGMLARLIDEAYPNYEAVIPTQNDRKLTVNRDVLLAAVKRVAPFGISYSTQ